MALFKKKKQEEQKINPSQNQQPKDVKDLKLNSEKQSIKLIKNVLIKPLLTEKSNNLMALNKYVFLVSRDANKSLVKQNVAERYNVKVEKVDIVNIKGKVKYYKNRPYKRSDIKKAIVTLKKGEKIEVQ